MKGKVSAIAAIALLAASHAASAQGRGGTAPRVVTQEQFTCLLQHRAEIAVSKRGTIIDLADCPPKPVLGAFPQRMSERYLLLTPADLKCLRSIKPGDRSIVKRRKDGKVALHLRPCGK